MDLSQPVAVAFTPNGTNLATANLKSNDITIFKVTDGLLSHGISEPLPDRSSQPRSIVFLTSLDSDLLIATSNSGSNDITIFQLKSGDLTKLKSYSLPAGETDPEALALSANGNYIVTANQ